MIAATLEQFVITQLFTFLLLFCRLGAGVMLLPGIGEAYVSARARLIFALGFSLVLVPVLMPMMPPVPTSPLGVAVLIICEIAVGLFLGGLARIITSALHVAGTIIASQSSLSIATLFDPSMGSQNTVVGNFLSVCAVVLMFTLNLHHLMLQALADSYSIFTPGQFPVLGDMAEYVGELMGRSFAVGVKLAAPHLVFSLIFYLGAGILARLMPQLQIFFLIISPQIFMSLFLLMAVLSTIMMEYAGFLEDTFISFTGQ